MIAIVGSRVACNDYVLKNKANLGEVVCYTSSEDIRDRIAGYEFSELVILWNLPLTMHELEVLLTRVRVPPAARPMKHPGDLQQHRPGAATGRQI